MSAFLALATLCGKTHRKYPICHIVKARAFCGTSLGTTIVILIPDPTSDESDLTYTLTRRSYHNAITWAISINPAFLGSLHNPST